MPVIASVGTAVPAHRISQAESRQFAENLFGEAFADIKRLLAVFASTQIDCRYFCMPLDWFQKPHSLAEKNALYVEHGVSLAAKAIVNCLQEAGLSESDIDHLVFVSSTGIATPSLDAHLFNRLRLRMNLKRTPIFGLGCAGGAAGVARAYDLACAHPTEKVMVVCLELCGLTFLYNDRSKSNLIATSLFADGCAAALIVGDAAAKTLPTKGPRVIGTQSTLWPDSLDVMGWDVQDEGLKVVFSKDIPSIVQTKIKPQVERFFQEKGLAVTTDLSRLVAHPGGVKVLEAYEAALRLPSTRLQHSRDVLRQYGNMSSCTVLFVLAEELQEAHRGGEHGLMLSLGPGFSCEQVMLEW